MCNTIFFFFLQFHCDSTADDAKSFLPFWTAKNIGVIEIIARKKEIKKKKVSRIRDQVLLLLFKIKNTFPETSDFQCTQNIISQK